MLPASHEHTKVTARNLDNAELAGAHGGTAGDPFDRHLAPGGALQEWLETGFRVDGKISGLKVACLKKVLFDDFEIIGYIVGLDPEHMLGEKVKGAVAEAFEIRIAVEPEGPAVTGSEDDVVALIGFVEEIGDFRDVGDEITIHHQNMGRLR